MQTNYDHVSAWETETISHDTTFQNSTPFNYIAQIPVQPLYTDFFFFLMISWWSKKKTKKKTFIISYHFPVTFPEDFWISVLKHLCIFSRHKLMSVLLTAKQFRPYVLQSGEEECPMFTMCLFFLFSMECLGLLSLITYIASRIISSLYFKFK